MTGVGEPDLVRELTPPGRGGVSVLELAGPALRRLCDLAGELPPVNGLRVVRLRSEGELLEEALVVRTGEQRAELHLTGSPPLVRRVLGLLGGERASPPRAVEERARRLLAGAPSEAAGRILLDQVGGALRRELLARADDPTEAWDAWLAELLGTSRVASFALAPRDVALVGPVNAGKSTLFNALVGHERAVVSEEPGTTRDALSAPALLGAYPVRLFDTAGERELESGADAEVERRGQALSLDLARRASLVLELVPADGPPPAALREGDQGPLRRRLRTRVDLVPGARGDGAISALRDPAGARRAVGELYRGAFALPEDPWAPRAACAFEPDLARALARLAGSPPSRREALLALLDGERARGR